jgi:hypothetical protein
MAMGNQIEKIASIFEWRNCKLWNRNLIDSKNTNQRQRTIFRKYPVAAAEA